MRRPFAMPVSRLLAVRDQTRSAPRASHESVGRTVGLSAEEMAEIRAVRVPALHDPHEKGMRESGERHGRG